MTPGHSQEDFIFSQVFNSKALGIVEGASGSKNESAKALISTLEHLSKLTPEQRQLFVTLQNEYIQHSDPTQQRLLQTLKKSCQQYQAVSSASNASSSEVKKSANSSNASSNKDKTVDSESAGAKRKLPENTKVEAEASSKRQRTTGSKQSLAGEKLEVDKLEVDKETEKREKKLEKRAPNNSFGTSPTSAFKPKAYFSLGAKPKVKTPARPAATRPETPELAKTESVENLLEGTKSSPMATDEQILSGSDVGKLNRGRSVTESPGFLPR